MVCGLPHACAYLPCFQISIAAAGVCVGHAHFPVQITSVSFWIIPPCILLKQGLRCVAAAHSVSNTASCRSIF